MFGKKITRMLIDNGEIIDGEVMPDNFEIPAPKSWTEKAWEFFHSSAHDQTVGGGKPNQPIRDNGRISYDGVNWQWENTGSGSVISQQVIIPGYGDSTANDGTC